MTGMELARRSGVSPSYISLIEHGDKVPSEEVAVRIAQALGENEDLYRVWAATARLPEPTRRALINLPPSPPVGDELDWPELSRPPGRPRQANGHELGPAYALDNDLQARVHHIPLLTSGPLADELPPPPSEVESLLAIDARLLPLAGSENLVAVRGTIENTRLAAPLLRSRDLIVLHRRPNRFDPQQFYAWRLDAGLLISRGALVPSGVILLPTAPDGPSPLYIPLSEPQMLHELLFGVIVWTSRSWIEP